MPFLFLFFYLHFFFTQVYPFPSSRLVPIRFISFFFSPLQISIASVLFHLFFFTHNFPSGSSISLSYFPLLTFLHLSSFSCFLPPYIFVLYSSLIIVFLFSLHLSFFFSIPFPSCFSSTCLNFLQCLSDAFSLY